MLREGTRNFFKVWNIYESLGQSKLYFLILTMNIDIFKESNHSLYSIFLLFHHIFKLWQEYERGCVKEKIFFFLFFQRNKRALVNRSKVAIVQ